MVATAATYAVVFAVVVVVVSAAGCHAAAAVPVLLLMMMMPPVTMMKNAMKSTGIHLIVFAVDEAHALGLKAVMAVMRSRTKTHRETVRGGGG